LQGLSKMAESIGSEVLGDSLIPVINKLQDIFSQVREHADRQS
jgi:hypothetical protein